jgi:hypothetical protein
MLKQIHEFLLVSIVEVGKLKEESNKDGIKKD